MGPYSGVTGYKGELQKIKQNNNKNIHVSALTD